MIAIIKASVVVMEIVIVILDGMKNHHWIVQVELQLKLNKILDILNFNVKCFLQFFNAKKTAIAMVWGLARLFKIYSFVIVMIL